MDVNVGDKVNEFPVGSEQNPAKSWAELPDGAGLVVRVQRDGTRCKQWYKNGGYHRVDGPAVEWTSGTKFWYQNGEKLSEAEFIHRIQKGQMVDPKGTPNTTDSTITPDEFPVGSEQNPAKDRDDIPEGTGLVVDGRGTKF